MYCKYASSTILADKLQRRDAEIPFEIFNEMGLVVISGSIHNIIWTRLAGHKNFKALLKAEDTERHLGGEPIMLGEKPLTLPGAEMQHLI